MLALRDRLSEEQLEQGLKGGYTRLGIHELKPEQWEAVQLLLEGKNVFVTLPTGYGKLAIYHLLPHCARALLGACSSQPSVVIVLRPSSQTVTKLIAAYL